MIPLFGYLLEWSTDRPNEPTDERSTTSDVFFCIVWFHVWLQFLLLFHLFPLNIVGRLVTHCALVQRKWFPLSQLKTWNFNWNSCTKTAKFTHLFNRTVRHHPWSVNVRCIWNWNWYCLCQSWIKIENEINTRTKNSLKLERRCDLLWQNLWRDKPFTLTTISDVTLLASNY